MSEKDKKPRAKSIGKPKKKNHKGRKDKPEGYESEYEKQQKQLKKETAVKYGMSRKNPNIKYLMEPDKYINNASSYITQKKVERIEKMLEELISKINIKI